MIFKETKLKGAFVIEPERLCDSRGFFSRTFCEREFIQHGLNPRVVQCNVSFNRKKGTLRGIHHQIAPHQEDKLIRCTNGSIYDVIIDLRSESSTFKEWFSVELNSENKKMIYVPMGFSHGFMTLKDNTEVFYQMSEFYYPEYNRGIRWNDPTFKIVWPEKISFISEKDMNFPDFSINI
jgi:dTDP-4-dehydrorhamnose 3,5-epimerase